MMSVSLGLSQNWIYFQLIWGLCILCSINFGYFPTLEARDRISALESELARLKAQIAVYALSEEDSDAPVPPPPPPVPPPPIPPSQQVPIFYFFCYT